MLFKNLLTANETEIKSYMNWNNYGLNETQLEVENELKTHALMVLSKSYGRYEVDADILDELCSDVFIQFPVLMQQLAISRLMDAYAVATHDVNTETLTRTENLSSEVAQESELNHGATVTDTTTLNTQHKTTGTVGITTEDTTENEGTIDITNTTNIQQTGSKNVNLSYNMPEQSIIAGTGYFPSDAQGTPIVNTSYAQNASASHNTTNPIATTETSEQNNNHTVTHNVDSTTTNDVTVADTGTTARATVNAGSDNSESTTLTDTTHTIEENRTSNNTNKQYAYEIKAFLESVDSVVAFRNWENAFSWVVGIL